MVLEIFLFLPKLSVAMETTISIQSAPQPNAVNPPKIDPLALEIFVFESAYDERRGTLDACLSYKLTCEPSAQVS